MIKAAIVGLGWWGKHILRSTAGSRKLQITRGVDLRLDALNDVTEAEPLPLSNDLEEVLRDSEIDAVILATPHSFHEEQIVLCATAGKHVFVEKPMTLTRAGAAIALNACETAGVVLGVGYERRFEPALKAIEKLIRDGSLGTLMHVESNFSHNLLASVDSTDWRASPQESPIPALSAMGIHLTDTYIHLFGPISEVFAQTSKRCGNWKSGDTLSVQFLFESGLTGYLSAILVTSMFVRFHVFGSQGWVQARSDAHPSQDGVTRLSFSQTGQVMQTQDFAYCDTVLENLEAFASAIAGEADYPFTYEEKLGNVSTMEAIIESARTGRSVAVE